MQQNYKVGDLVECVDNSNNEEDAYNLTLGKLYKVLHTRQYGFGNYIATIDDTGRKGTFFYSRFKLATSTQPKPSNKRKANLKVTRATTKATKATSGQLAAGFNYRLTEGRTCKFDQRTRISAVADVLEGQQISAVAQKVGCCTQTLKNWIASFNSWTPSLT